MYCTDVVCIVRVTALRVMKIAKCPAARAQRSITVRASSGQKVDAPTEPTAGNTVACTQPDIKTTTDIAVKTATKDSKTAASQSSQAAQSGSSQSAAADPACPKAHITKVAGDADVMLNQTNIGANNNKFYRMQLLQEGSSDHWLWTRWGRVADKGQTQLQGPFDTETGYREFKKKFRYYQLMHKHTSSSTCFAKGNVPLD